MVRKDAQYDFSVLGLIGCQILVWRQLAPCRFDGFWYGCLHGQWRLGLAAGSVVDLNSRAADWGSQEVPELMPARWWLRVSQTVLASGWVGQVFTQLALEPWYSQGWCLWGPGSLGTCPCPLVAESGLRASSCPWWMELGTWDVLELVLVSWWVG